MRKFTEQEANAIWDILIAEAGANGDLSARHDFLHEALSGNWTEWRFGGKLGFGGKVRNNMGRVYVTCYRENETPSVNAAIEKTNELLKQYEKSY